MDGLVWLCEHEELLGVTDRDMNPLEPAAPVCAVRRRAKLAQITCAGGAAVSTGGAFYASRFLL